MDSRPQTDVEIDVRALFGVLLRRLPYLIVFVLIVAVGTYVVLGRVPPVYKSEATVFLESGESNLTRTTQTGAGDATAVFDDAAIASQIQLIRSRDLAAAVSKQLDLPNRAEFDPNRQPSALTQLLQKIGLAHPDTAMPEERALGVYFKSLTVTSLEKSRVIAIDFSSTNP